MTQRLLAAVSVAVAALLCTPALAAPEVRGVSAMRKVRPDAPPPAAEPVALLAAPNEFVSFQVVVAGRDTGARGVHARLFALEGPDRIDGDEITLYRETYLDVSHGSGGHGELGRWPDGLVPDVDEVAHERRNAFPFDVPAGENRVLWVDVHVPKTAAPGDYSGELEVSGEAFSSRVPLRVTVVDAAPLPSTSTLPSAFLLWRPHVCNAHTGTADCGGAEAAAPLLARYQELALDHRVSIPSGFFAIQPAAGDWSRFDSEYAPFLDGRAPGRLRGARMTSAQYMGPADPGALADFTAHFAAHGWLDRAYDYSGDEPPWGISFEELKQRLALVRGAAPALTTLVTTPLRTMQENGLQGQIDRLVVPLEFLEGTVSSYQPFLAGPRRSLWGYTSCLSQGCAYGSTTPEEGPDAGAPSYLIDRSAAKNRSVQWLLFSWGVSGELYYQTVGMLGTAWQDQFRFNGNGDGTLLYPGRTDVIGGRTDVPLPSLRLKYIRMGMQDHAWLTRVAEAGDPDFARSVASGLVPSAARVTDDGAAFEAARARLVQRYLELRPHAPPRPGTPGVGGDAPLAQGCSFIPGGPVSGWLALALLAIAMLSRRVR